MCSVRGRHPRLANSIKNTGGSVSNTAQKKGCAELAAQTESISTLFSLACHSTFGRIETFSRCTQRLRLKGSTKDSSRERGVTSVFPGVGKPPITGTPEGRRGTYACLQGLQPMNGSQPPARSLVRSLIQFLPFWLAKRAQVSVLVMCPFRSPFPFSHIAQ